VEDLGKCGAAAIGELGLYGSGLLGEPLMGATALRESAGLEFAGGEKFRTFGPMVALCSELTSGLADGLGSVAGDEFEPVERTSAKGSEACVLSLGFPS